MSCSFTVPSQWDDFEQLFDKLVTDRYGAPSSTAPSTPLSASKKSTPPAKSLATGPRPAEKALRPRIDVVETDASIVVTAELPGAKKEDVSIELHNGRLTVAGQIQAPAEHAQGTVHISERTFGNFSRTLAVPQTVTHEHIQARFSDGVLEITVPKIKASHESFKIPIA